MATFDRDTLKRLHDTQEIAIRTGKHPDKAVTTWVAVAGEEVFVRSVRGPSGRWYRDLATGGPAELEFAGRRLAVHAIPAHDELGPVQAVSARHDECGDSDCRPGRWPGRGQSRRIENFSAGGRAAPQKLT